LQNYVLFFTCGSLWINVQVATNDLSTLW